MRVAPGSIYRSADGRSEVRRWCADELDRWELPTERTVVTVDGAHTHVLTAGAGQATVVFLPGTTSRPRHVGPSWAPWRRAAG